MRLVIQRVNHASVSVDDKCVGSIKYGFLILAGTTHGDSDQDAELLARKTARLRIFADESGKTNRSLLDVNGEALVVSQFTLYADTRKGNRPSFGQTGSPEEAKRLLDTFVDALKAHGVTRVERGVFGADMQVDLSNTGPFTVILES